MTPQPSQEKESSDAEPVENHGVEKNTQRKSSATKRENLHRNSSPTKDRLLTPTKPSFSNYVTVHTPGSENSDQWMPCSPPEYPPSEAESDTSSDSRPAYMRKRYYFIGLVFWGVFLKQSGLLDYGQVVVEQQMGPLFQQLLDQYGIGEFTFSQFNQSISLSYLTQQSKRPGYQLAEKGATMHHPVVIVPGFVTSGLEVWAGKDCARKYFRQRLWAAFGGARSFLLERECWAQHMMLDLYQGGDPDGIRLRASEGFFAVDFFLGNYWVFGKLIENLADLGYTPSSATVMPYDWRLAYNLLEERDGFMSALADAIERQHKIHRRKVVLSTHSMGALVCHYFFKWVTSAEGGNRGEKWVDEHIHAYVSIAGSFLGVPKAASALLSGEMSDTVFQGAMHNVLENFFGRKIRRDLWSSWGSLWTMLPLGGDSIWGVGADMCHESTLNDPFCPSDGSASPLLVMSDTETNRTQGMELRGKVLTSEENLARQFLLRGAHTVGQVVRFISSYGAGLGRALYNARSISQGDREKSFRSWHDPTRTPLPYAPNMKIYCLYGVGIPTERGYMYQRAWTPNSSTDIADPPVYLDSSVSNESSKTIQGVRYSNGDGSVPLLSLGHVCTDIWGRKDPYLNPSASKVYTREYQHHAEFTVDDPMRGGPRSGEHVDILGHLDMTHDFLRIVSNFDVREVNKNQIVSDILNISAAVREASSSSSRPRRRFRLSRWLRQLVPPFPS